MKKSARTIGKGFANTSRKLSGILGMLFVAIGYYMFGPFLHSETWQQLRYKIKLIKEKLQTH